MCMCVWVAVTHKQIFVDVCFVLFCFYLLFSLPSSLFDLSTNIYTTSNTNIKIPLEQPPPPPLPKRELHPGPAPPAGRPPTRRFPLRGGTRSACFPPQKSSFFSYSPSSRKQLRILQCAPGFFCENVSKILRVVNTTVYIAVATQA